LSFSWIIWYDDGSSFTNLDGKIHEAPRWGVMCIAQYSKDHGRVIVHGYDYYFWEKDEWLSGDLVGLIDYLTRDGIEKVVLIGRSVPPAEFWKIYELANQDPRLPPRSSYSPFEKH